MTNTTTAPLPATAGLVLAGDHIHAIDGVSLTPPVLVEHVVRTTLCDHDDAVRLTVWMGPGMGDLVLMRTTLVSYTHAPHRAPLS